MKSFSNGSMTPRRVAHFVSAFPVLSETFVLDEMAAFAEEGFENIVVSLRPRPRPAETTTRVLEGDALRDLAIIHISYPDISSPFRETIQSLRHVMRPPNRSMLSSGFYSPGEIPHLLFTSWRAANLRDELKRLGVHHCHGHFAHYPATLAWACSRTLGTTLTWNAHSYDLFNYRAHLTTKIRDAEGVFPVSENNLRRILDWAPEIETVSGKCEVIRCGIPLDRYPFDDRTRSIPSQDAPTLLAVGRLVDTKGFLTLVESVKILAESGTDFEVSIAGEGPERPKLESLIRDLGMTGKVKLLGALSREETRRLQGQATIAVQPCCSGREGLDGIPVVLMEAMALGVPVVSTRFAAIPELVEDGATGLLVEPKNPRRLADAILKLLRDPKTASILAKKARSRIESDYDGPANYRRKALAIRKLLEKSKFPAGTN